VRLWRISNHADLSGEGGRLAAGRWNLLGRRVVYLAEHPALALLETLVHLEIDPEDMPSGFRLLTAEAPDNIPVASLDEAGLDTTSPGWRSDPAITRALGEAFFVAGSHALLRVPSVLVPEARNVLLDPLHPAAAGVRIVAEARAAFDDRLLRRL